MKNHAATGIGLITSIIAIVAAVCSQGIPHPWPLFRHDQERSGRSAYPGPATPLFVWSYATGAPVQSSLALDANGMVYTGSFDGNCYSLNRTGVLSWSYTTGAAVFSTPALDESGKLYVGGLDNKLYALGATGTLSWHYASDDVIYSSPLVMAGGRACFGSSDQNIYVVGQGGALLWSYDTGDEVITSPSRGPAGEIYAGSFSNSLTCALYSLDANGGLRWSYCAGKGIVTSPARDGAGRVHFGSYDNNVYCIDSQGALSWSYTAGDHFDSSPALGFAGEVFHGSADNRLYAFTSRGSLRWSYELPDALFSSPAIDSAGNLYTNAGTSSLAGSCFSFTRQGAFRWSYESGGGPSSPVLGADGRVYVGSTNGSIYCLGPTALPTVTPTATPEIIPHHLNYINLDAAPETVSGGSPVTLTWQCDFSQWDYRGVPVDLYLAAIRSPNISNAPVSVDVFLAEDEVYLFGRDMARIYRFTGRLEEPTMSPIAFPPAPVTGSLLITTPVDTVYRGEYTLALTLIRRDTNTFVRPDNHPIETSPPFTIR